MSKKTYYTAEERRSKALGILAKGGYLPKCKSCDSSVDRKADGGLCKQCYGAKESKRLISEMKEKEDKIKEEKYEGRAGMWA